MNTPQSLYMSELETKRNQVAMQANKVMAEMIKKSATMTLDQWESLNRDYNNLQIKKRAISDAIKRRNGQASYKSAIDEVNLFINYLES